MDSCDVHTNVLHGCVTTVTMFSPLPWRIWVKSVSTQLQRRTKSAHNNGSLWLTGDFHWSGGRHQNSLSNNLYRNFWQVFIHITDRTIVGLLSYDQSCWPRLFHAPTRTTSSGCLVQHRAAHALWNLYENPSRNRAERKKKPSRDKGIPR